MTIPAELSQVARTLTYSGDGGTAKVGIGTTVDITGGLAIRGVQVINSAGVWQGSAAGIQGTQGTQGIQGIQGSQGIQGTQGIQGILGTQGIQGSQGIQGTQGIQGSTGTQGTAGSTGSQGTTGTTGTQGTQGITGPTGGTDGQVLYRSGGSATSSSNLQFNGTDLTIGSTVRNSSGRIILRQSQSILQVVSTIKTNTFSTTLDSMTNVTGLSVSITPTSTSSKILVCYSVHMGQNAQYYLSAGDITRNGSQIAIGDADGSRGRFTFGTQDGGGIHGSTYCYSGQYLDSPSSTSSLTYQIRIRSEGGNTVWVNRGNESDGDSSITQRLVSMITLLEVAG